MKTLSGLASDVDLARRTFISFDRAARAIADENGEVVPAKIMKARNDAWQEFQDVLAAYNDALTEWHEQQIKKGVTLSPLQVVKLRDRLLPDVRII